MRRLLRSGDGGGGEDPDLTLGFYVFYESGVTLSKPSAL